MRIKRAYFKSTRNWFQIYSNLEDLVSLRGFNGIFGNHSCFNPLTNQTGELRLIEDREGYFLTCNLCPYDVSGGYMASKEEDILKLKVEDLLFRITKSKIFSNICITCRGLEPYCHSCFDSGIDPVSLEFSKLVEVTDMEKSESGWIYSFNDGYILSEKVDLSVGDLVLRFENNFGSLDNERQYQLLSEFIEKEVPDWGKVSLNVDSILEWLRACKKNFISKVKNERILQYLNSTEVV